VYVAIPPPYYGVGKEEGFKKNVNVALPAAIRALVDKIDGVRLIDNQAALGGRALARPHTFTSDGVHPNDIGYFAIAHQVPPYLGPLSTPT
jgi:lysophospholipase L1-like esterase